MYLVILFYITRRKTLLGGIEVSEIPLQLLHCLRSLFFCNLIMIPLSQSVGSTSWFYIFVKRWCKMLLDVSVSVFNISALMLSMPAAFPFFSCLIALCISSLLNFSVFISNCSPSGCMSGAFLPVAVHFRMHLELLYYTTPAYSKAQMSTRSDKLTNK